MEKRPKVKSKIKLTIGSTSTVTECYKCAVITNAKRREKKTKGKKIETNESTIYNLEKPQMMQYKM